MKPSWMKHVLNMAILIVFAIITWYLYPNREQAYDYIFELGKPWTYEPLSAEYDFPIYKSEQQLANDRKTALQDFAPYFNASTPVEPKYWIISGSDMTELQEQGYQHLYVLDKATHIAQSIPLQQVYTPKTAFETFHQDWQPNLQLDTLSTQKIKNELIQSVSLTEGVVQKGQRIVDRGEIVTPELQRMLDSYFKILSEKKVFRHHSVLMQIGLFLYILMSMALLGMYIYVFRPRLWQTRHLLFFCVLMGLVIFPAFFIVVFFNSNYIFLVPFAWVPIITRVFYDARTAFIVNVATALLIALLTQASLLFLCIQICVGQVVITTLNDMSQRSQLVRTAATILLTYILATIIVSLAKFGHIDPLMTWKFPISMAFIFVLMLCVYGPIFIFEKAFKLVSNVTLVELTNVNSDLMHQFAEEAPGTFQHSLQVSNLATDAAKRIGANALLVRAGALYHDIGKMEHPMYYTENQGDGENILLGKSNIDAAKIIIQHVKAGEKIARKNGLPEVIIRFISTHHGTSLVRYFYNTEKNQNPDKVVDPNDFRYPGPTPASKEEAILMMADAIEARSRSLKEYTEQGIRDMVNDMILQQVNDGQFAQTPLTFQDITVIQEVFTERLITINHHRIQYPTIK